jgi:hypothetical protein
MIECPHCFLRVIPTREGLCPACSGSTKSPDSKWSSISICPSTTLPRFCCVCNEPTSFVRRVKIGDWDRELEREEKQNGLGCLFTAIAIFNPIALLFRLVLLLAAFIVFVVQALIKSKAAVSHVVRIPLCTRNGLVSRSQVFLNWMIRMHHLDRSDKINDEQKLQPSPRSADLTCVESTARTR